VTRVQDSNTHTSNGQTSPQVAPAQEESSSSSIPTFNIDEVRKMLADGVDPNAEVYRPPKSDTKPAGPSGPWAPKGENRQPLLWASFTNKSTGSQMANGKDFFVELRKQITEKFQESEKEEAAAKQENKQEVAKGG
jgi:hypothetical protein